MSTTVAIGDIKSSPGKMRVSHLFKIDPRKIPRKLLWVFVPSKKREKNKLFEADLVGPIIVVLMLCGILEYGAALRKTIAPLSPTEALAVYVILVPLGTILLLKAGKTTLTYVQVLSLLGYGLFCHILTILFTISMRMPHSHLVFFVFFTILGGLSSIRMLIVFTIATQRPAFQLLASCFAFLSHLLLLLFSYFSYIPRL